MSPKSATSRAAVVGSDTIDRAHFAFDTLGLERVQAFVLDWDPASAHVLGYEAGGGRRTHEESEVMDVYEAVTSRRAVRAFIDRPVPTRVLWRVLTAAARAPSGGNIQPWHTFVLSGTALAELKKRVAQRLAAGDPGDEREFEMYPLRLKSPYRERKLAAGEQRFGVLGIAREDSLGRRAAVVANWDCFGAPAALFCYIDRGMGSAQWADVGMYLQTIMLLLRAEGLHSCPQMSWSVYRRTVAEIVSPPDELILFCGMSIGFEDVAVPHVCIDRAPLVETVRFLD